MGVHEAVGLRNNDSQYPPEWLYFSPGSPRFDFFIGNSNLCLKIIINGISVGVYQI